MSPRYSPRRGLHLGTDLENGNEVFLGDEWMRTGTHVLGRTGSGKTRLGLHFFSQLAADDRAATIVLSPKGDLGPMCRDYAIDHGLSKRLVMFDPADRTNVVGYNPLKPNGVDPYVQAHLVRQALLAAHGQTSIDRTQQLGRMLMIALSIARILELTFLEACELLRADSEIRACVLEHLTDPELVRALRYFDGLRAQRQDELAASSLARLEAFTTFPVLREIVSQQAHSLDLGEIMRERKILIINLEVFNPLPLDDVKALGRLLVNDILAHAFARPRGQRTPVRLIIDEAELFATETLCFALNMGRELGLVPILLHQELEQLTLEDDSRKLYAAVMSDTLVKIVSGSTTPEDLRRLADTLFLHDFDPMSVKDELTSLELDPFREWVEVETETTSWQRGKSGGLSLNVQQMRATTEAVARMRARARGTHESIGSVSGDGCTDGESPIVTPDGIVMVPTHSTIASGSDVYNAGTSEIETEAETDSRAKTKGMTKGVAKISGWTEQDGGSRSVALVPVTGNKKRRAVSSRAFWTYDEHVIRRMQAAGRLGVGEFIVKVPGKPAHFFRAPFVRDPFVPERLRSAALARMHELPYYARPAEITLEAAARADRLRLLDHRDPEPRREVRDATKPFAFTLPTPTKRAPRKSPPP